MNPSNDRAPRDAVTHPIGPITEHLSPSHERRSRRRDMFENQPKRISAPSERYLQFRNLLDCFRSNNKLGSIVPTLSITNETPGRPPFKAYFQGAHGKQRICKKAKKTLKRFLRTHRPMNTPLKQGVNEKRGLHFGFWTSAGTSGELMAAGRRHPPKKAKCGTRTFSNSLIFQTLSSSLFAVNRCLGGLPSADSLTTKGHG